MREKRAYASERGWWIDKMMVRFRRESRERVKRIEKAVVASSPRIQYMGKRSVKNRENDFSC
jgi:hypothetical protein